MVPCHNMRLHRACNIHINFFSSEEHLFVRFHVWIFPNNLYIHGKKTVYFLIRWLSSFKKAGRFFQVMSFNFITVKQLLIIMQCVCYFCSNGLLGSIQLDEQNKPFCCSLDKKMCLNKLCAFFSIRDTTLFLFNIKWKQCY